MTSYKHLTFIKFVSFNRHHWHGCQGDGYNGLFQQNCLLIIINCYNYNYVISVSKNEKIKRNLQANIGIIHLPIKFY